MRMRKGTAGYISGAIYIYYICCSSAYAQGNSAEEGDGLDVIIVTAQKREQSVQDVPIAVTALSGDTLRANRIVNVSDLSGLAPGFTVRTATGGQQLPSFSVRGVVSYGIVPGSDKQVSMYLDGVYISSPKGAIFDLPDVERIELLRGPQGTLFGRNATAGAVSITTRDPKGEAGVHGEFTIGNRDQYRFRTGVELPRMGPFSGYLSYVHEEYRGDIRNASAGQVWDRSAARTGSAAKILRSPNWLGDKSSDSWFAALKFESGDFKTVYKYDRNENEATPEANVLIGINPNLGVLSTLLTTLVQTQPQPIVLASNGKRPKVAYNGWTVPRSSNSQGHSLTSTYEISDALSVKNIFGYRKSVIFAITPLDAISSLTFTAQAVPIYAAFARISEASAATFVGQPFVSIGAQQQGRSEQYSDEIQFNYDSDFLTATAGGLWFHSKDWTDEHNFTAVSFSPVPNGVIVPRNIGRGFNKATSMAAYAQLEFHITPQLDVIAGGRVTRDRKFGSLTYGAVASPMILRSNYRDTRPNYLIGVNYKPTDDLLIYAKYSTAYVSGGSVGGIPFAPETAKSWEAGVKAEMLNRKLRANLAVYQATYRNFQTAQAANNFRDEITRITGDPNRAASIGTFVVSQGGPVKAKGFEADFTVSLLRNFNLGGALGFNDTKFQDVNPILISASGGAYIEDSYRPKWNGNLWAQYDSPPLTGGAYMSVRADGVWQSDMALAANPAFVATFAPALVEQPSYWVVNGRIALKNVDIGGVSTQIAAWGRNLTDKRAIAFSTTPARLAGAAIFIPARRYGFDLIIDF